MKKACQGLSQPGAHGSTDWAGEQFGIDSGPASSQGTNPH